MAQGLPAMKPRQVLLSSSFSSAGIPSNAKPLSLSDQKPLLLQAVCNFLESNGFSKTLKKFLSEASLEKDSWKDCLLNLEDACCWYLDARSQNDAGENISSDKKSEKIVDDDTNVKSKENKKKKSGKDSSTQNVEVHSVEPEVALGDTLCEEKSSKKSKDKKKKKGSEPAPESLNGNIQTSCAEKGSEESTDPEKSSKSIRKKNKDSKIDTEEDKKSSKKSNDAPVGNDEGAADDITTAGVFGGPILFAHGGSSQAPLGEGYTQYPSAPPGDWYASMSSDVRAFIQGIQDMRVLLEQFQTSMGHMGQRLGNLEQRTDDIYQMGQQFWSHYFHAPYSPPAAE